MTPIIRPYRSSDTPGVLAVLTASMPCEAISESRFTRQVLLDPNFRPEGALVAECDHLVAGFILALARQVPLENAPSDADTGYITLLGVLSSHLRNGIGSLLLDKAEDFLRGQNRKQVVISSYAPGYFIPGVDVNAYGPALSFLAGRGYKEVYRPLAMQVPLWSFAMPPWVAEKRKQREAEGIRIEPYNSSLTLPLLEFAAREFMGEWVRVVRQTIEQILDGQPATRLMIAHQEDKVVGFSHFEQERFGPIGTAASMRGKGLGQILMYATLAAQRDQGLRASWFLWSDDKTASRIYSAAGFSEIRRFALLKKDL